MGPHTAAPPPKVRPLLPKTGAVSRFFAGLLVGLLQALPQGALRALAAFVGGAAWHLGIRRRLTLDNLSNALPELPEEKRRQIAKGAYRNMSLAALESIASADLSEEEVATRVVVENWELVERLRAEGNGLLVATAHFGNWELLGAVMARRGLPLHAVVRPLQGAVNARIVETRLRSGLKLIHPRGAIHSSVAALREGAVVAMLVDQVISPHRAVWVPFFGRLAATSPGFSLTAQKSRAPVIVAMAARDGDRLRVHLEGPLPVPQTGDAEEDVRAHTAQVTSVVEKWIRRYPEQWLWLHRRWKYTPPESAAASNRGPDPVTSGRGSLP